MKELSYLDGSLKNLKKLTNIDDFKIDELDIKYKNNYRQ